MPRSPFSLRLDLLPVPEDLVGVLRVHVAEDVRVAMNELLDDAGDDVVDGERALLAAELGLEHDLEEQVAELLADRLAVAGVDGVDDLAGLLEGVFPERFERLLAVPRAAVGGEEPAHDADEARQRGAVLGLQGGTGRGTSSSKRGSDMPAGLST